MTEKNRRFEENQRGLILCRMGSRRLREDRVGLAFNVYREPRGGADFDIALPPFPGRAHFFL